MESREGERGKGRSISDKRAGTFFIRSHGTMMALDYGL